MISNNKVNMVLQWLSVLARVVLGGIFIWSAIYKIKWPYVFLGNVYDYEIVGPRFGILIAMVLPWVELFVGMCLLGNILTKGAILIATGMMGLFVFLHAFAIYNGLAIRCGCFGVIGVESVSYLSLFRNCLLLILCVICFGFGPDSNFAAFFTRSFLWGKLKLFSRILGRAKNLSRISE
jgi:hypothetical protein